MVPFKFNNQGGMEKPLWQEVSFSIHFELAELFKSIRVKKVINETQPNVDAKPFEHNYESANEIKKSPTIEMGDRSLAYLGQSKDEDEAAFMYFDKSQNIHQVIHITLRYYQAFQGWLNLKEQKEAKMTERKKKAEFKEEKKVEEDRKDKFKDGAYIFMP